MQTFAEGSLHQSIQNLLVPIDSEQKQQFMVTLAPFFGNRLLLQADRLTAYSYDATAEQYRPDAALVVENEDELRRVLEAADKFGIPVIARGSGSNISGGTLPIVGGIVLSLTRLKHIRKIDPENRSATVEPGVVNADLQMALKPYGFFFPPDPASHRIATVGGNVAEGSGGPHCVKYGTTTHYVRSLRVLLADGTPVVCSDKFTRVDWPGLLTGSEGTLAVITEMTVRIIPLPSHTGMLLAGFSSVVEAVSAVSGIVRARQIPSTLELLDKATLDTVRPFINAGYPNSEAVLLIEVDGSEASVQQQLEQLVAILKTFHAEPIVVAETPEQADRLMAARRSAYGAAARLASHVWTQDVTVPRPLLADMMSHVLTIARHYALSINTVAHAGDGNLHPLIPFHPDNRDEVDRMRAADHDILQKATELGGSITGEHGIGIDKLHELPLMFSEDELSAMYAVKRAFDPRGLLNPGKAVLPVTAEPSVSAPPQYPPLPGSLEPGSIPELREILRNAEFQHAPLGTDQNRYQGECRISLTHLRNIVDFDPDNMTITVEAGMPFEDFAAFLRDHRLMFPPVPLHSQQTLGALVAEGLPHLTQFGYGPLKNWILGVEVVDGRGCLLRFGRKIMKNVAGLDMPKLFIGSLGQYGIITTIILRLQPEIPTPRVYTLERGALTGTKDQDLVRKLSPLAPGVQGLWMFSGQIVIFLDGRDLATQESQLQTVLQDLNCSYQTHEAAPVIAMTQSFLSGLYHRAYDNNQAIILGCGQAEGVRDPYYLQLDGSLWIAPETNQNLKAFPGSRRLDQSGWHILGPEDPHLAAIAERIKHYFDPAKILTHVP
ncbi:MAG: FAD-binding oxidoreductase [Firmicutes bacterium]|nr:FAD-binding oxidoreductase [Bacillota bacterium]MCL5015888.1 FAD-binding oxidoreductase [Bacillota bacterium]